MYKGDKTRGEIEIIKKVKVYENKFCSFYDDEVSFPSGVDGHFISLEMRGGYSVAILPITKAGKMLFIKTFRHSARAWGYEVPKGYGDEKESHVECAKRELLEESGLVPGRIVDLGVYHESPSTIAFGIHCFIAFDCERTDYIYKEDTEVIGGRVEASSLEELPQGGYKDAITEMLVAKYFAMKKDL